MNIWLVPVFCVVVLASCGDSPKSLVASARDYAAKADYSAALIQLRNALQKEPYNAEARYLLGTVLIERRDPAGAIKELRKAVELGYPAEKVIPVLARALLDDGDAKDLVTEFGSTTLESGEGQAALKTSVGNAQLSLGNGKEAEAAFSQALVAKADYADALLGIATAYARNGDFGEADKVIDRVLAQPNPPREASLLKARLMIAQEHRQEAQAYLEQIVASKPDYADARYLLATLLIENEDLDRASAQVAAAKQAAKQDRRPYYFEALIASRRGDLPAAREAIQQVLKGGFEHVASLLLAGQIEFRAKQYNQAQDYLRRALKQAPQLTAAQRMLAATYLRLGTPAKALEVLEPSLARDSKDPLLMALAGETYLALGDFPRAARYFEQTTAADPNNVAVRTRLGQVRFAEGDTEGAIRDLEAASALDPSATSADLALVSNYIRQKKYEDALGVVARMEKKQPNSPLVYNLKGAVYLAKRDTASARAAFEKAVQVQSDYLPAISNLALLDRLDQKPDVARKRFEAVLEKEPKNEQALLGLASLLQSINPTSTEVEPLLKRALQANPQSMPIRTTLVNFYFGRGDSRQALLAAQEAVAAMPNDVRPLELLGRVQLSTGNATLAVDTFNKVVTLRPDNVESLLLLARALVGVKDYDKAIEKLRDALKINPTLFEANREIVTIYAMSDQPELALKEIKAIQREQPNDARGYVFEGDLLASQKKWPQAEAAYLFAMKKAPAEGMVAVKLHAVMSMSGKPGEAASMADKWLREHPKDLVLRAYLADRALQAKDYKSAVLHYQALLAQQPENPVFLNNIAWAAGEIGDPKAIAYAEKASALVPGNAAVLDTLGMLLVKRGEVDQGLEKIQKAAQLSPGQADIRLHLARALIKAGKRDAARKELEVLAQASGQPGAQGVTNAGGSTTEQKPTQQQTGSKPALVCNPDCAAETAALLKTL